MFRFLPAGIRPAVLLTMAGNDTAIPNCYENWEAFWNWMDTVHPTGGSKLENAKSGELCPEPQRDTDELSAGWPL